MAVRNAIALLLGAALGLVTILSLALAANLPSMHSSDLDEMLAIGGVATWFMLAYGLIFFAVAVSRYTTSTPRSDVDELANVPVRDAGHALRLAPVTPAPAPERALASAVTVEPDPSRSAR